MRLRLILQPAWVRFTVWSVFLAVWWGLFTSLQASYEFEGAVLSAIVFGAALGVLRMAAGGHFFTDVVFAGVLMYVLIWIIHGLIYRWRLTRLTDAAIERPLEQIGNAIRDGVAALFRRVSDRGKAGS